MLARAFCPGHVTGFFSIEDDASANLKKGSIGAGFCIEAGASAVVEISEPGEGTVSITVNGTEGPAPVTETALKRILGRKEMDVRARIFTELPNGQGFGMSAAGTFSASLALAHAMGLSDERNLALRATHDSEVQHGTGLGDAVAQNLGDFVLRTAPGIPPYGEARRYEFGAEVIFCVLDSPIETSKVLADPETRARITEEGRKCLADFRKDVTLDNFMDTSWQFAVSSGLAGPKLTALVEEIHGKEMGKAGMSMLGNTIFAVGDIRRLADFLGPHGELIKTRMERRGGTRLLI